MSRRVGSYDPLARLPCRPLFLCSLGCFVHLSFVVNLATSPFNQRAIVLRHGLPHGPNPGCQHLLQSLSLLSPGSSAAGCDTMSKIKSYTPGWLSKPSPGHALFQASAEDLNTSSFSSRRKARPGPRRTIARRGTEIFVAVNREIRWGDLVYLKDSWAEKAGRTRIKREDTTSSFSIYDETIPSIEGTDGEAAQGYRVRGTSVGYTYCRAVTDNMRRS